MKKLLSIKAGLGFLIESLILFLTAGSVIFFPFDRGRKCLLRLNNYYYQEMWQQVLDEAHQLPIERYYLIVNHDVNTALYHTGRFAEDMFAYPQDLRSLFAIDFKREQSKVSFSELPRISDTMYRLGMANIAEYFAYETFELIEYPEILQQLYFINIVRGSPEVARIYLNALSRDVIFGKWAENQLRLLDRDPLLSTDTTVQHIRSVMIQTDFSGSMDLEQVLLELMRGNKHNRMAFEYLMAFYLFSHRSDKIAQNIGRLDDIGYPGIPRLYEEAILVHLDETGEDVDLHGREISRHNFQRFREFKNFAAAYRNGRNRKAAYETLVRNFGDSYFFHRMFGHSGLNK